MIDDKANLVEMVKEDKPSLTINLKIGETLYILTIKQAKELKNLLEAIV